MTTCRLGMTHVEAVGKPSVAHFSLRFQPRANRKLPFSRFPLVPRLSLCLSQTPQTRFEESRPLNLIALSSRVGVLARQHRKAMAIAGVRLSVSTFFKAVSRVANGSSPYCLLLMEGSESRNGLRVYAMHHPFRQQ